VGTSRVEKGGNKILKISGGNRQNLKKSSRQISFVTTLARARDFKNQKPETF
jgi:hypothetical protein